MRDQRSNSIIIIPFSYYFTQHPPGRQQPMIPSILDFIREGLLAHFSFPFWLHIMIGQLIVCSKKHAEADWWMTCAKANWLRTNVLTFFLLSDWLVQNLPLFWFGLWCHLCHLWRQNCAYFGNPGGNFVSKFISFFYNLKARDCFSGIEKLQILSRPFS